MKSKFNRYVEEILCQMECKKEAKEDLYEEMMSHLELSRTDLIKEGMSEEEAELKAMELFGPKREISFQIQQAFFPYRKQLMLTLTFLSFFYVVTVYLFALFIEGDAYLGWFTFSVCIHTVLLLTALNQIIRSNRRRWIIGLLITHLLTNLYGYVIVSTFEVVYLPLILLNLLIIFLALLLVYQTTIYDELRKETNFSRRMNLTSGVLTFGITLFFLWVGLIMFNGFHPFMLLLVVPFTLWGFSFFEELLQR